MENCPHCKKKKRDLHEMQVGVAGNLLNVKVCTKCKEGLEKIMSFAQAFPTATGSTAQKPKEYKKPAPAKTAKPKPEQTKKFEQYALKPEEIAQTQALRPSIRRPDTPLARQKDDLDSVREGRRVTVYCYGVGATRGFRQKKIIADAMKQLGTANVRCVKDDGQFEAVFEAA